MSNWDGKERRLKEYAYARAVFDRATRALQAMEELLEEIRAHGQHLDRIIKEEFNE